MNKEIYVPIQAASGMSHGIIESMQQGINRMPMKYLACKPQFEAQF
ncbi:MAG: hypothetical protein K5838_08180 [Elusimicrobiales bacterium]|nr:hypothetical protein [Elusimicrobiales bacterium]